MGRSSGTRRLALWMNGERVGVWQLAAGRHELAYDDAWVASAQGRPMSLSLPFLPGNQPHEGQAVRSYFDNLLPDNTDILERLAQRFRAASTGAFDLLAQIGRDCVGAVQIVPESVAPGDTRRIDAEPLDEAAVARLLAATVTPPSRAGLAGTEDDFRISIAGAQEKTALLWHQGRWWRPRGATPTTHILKLPLGQASPLHLDLRESVENEWFCAQVLGLYGLPVAQCHPLVFAGQKVLAVERFDRRWAPGGRWLLRLPQEDMCQATGTPPHLKYESDGGPGIDRILRLLDASATRTQDRATFFRAQVLFWMLCAPDGHAKNFSLALRAQGRFSMTPLYDVMSAYPVLGKKPSELSPFKVKLAMALRTRNTHWRVHEIQRRHWLEVGRRNGVITHEGQDAAAIVDDLIERTPAVLQAARDKVPKGFPLRVAESILIGVQAAAAVLAKT